MQNKREGQNLRVEYALTSLFEKLQLGCNPFDVKVDGQVVFRQV